MTKIQWTDKTWNPTIGCTRVSPGCEHCYAIPQANMRASHPNPKIAAAFAGLTERTADRLDWTGQVNLLPDRLTQPLSWRKPRKVFVNSMSDLFADAVPTDFIARVFAVMAQAKQHTFQVLTKRHARMRALLSSAEFQWDVFDRMPPGMRTRVGPAEGWPLPNVWIGVSVEDQKWADIRIPALREAPAAVRFLSCEPLLGPLDRLDLTGVGWCIAGGESGHGARPMEPGWVRDLIEQCRSAGAAPFVKQLGSVWAKEHGGDSKGGDMAVWPDDLQVQEFPTA